MTTTTRKLTTQEIGILGGLGVTKAGRIQVTGWDEALSEPRRARYEVWVVDDSIELDPVKGGDTISSTVPKHDYRVTHAGTIAREAFSVAKTLARTLGLRS